VSIRETGREEECRFPDIQGIGRRRKALKSVKTICGTGILLIILVAIFIQKLLNNFRKLLHHSLSMVNKRLTTHGLASNHCNLGSIDAKIIQFMCGKAAKFIDSRAITAPVIKRAKRIHLSHLIGLLHWVSQLLQLFASSDNSNIIDLRQMRSANSAWLPCKILEPLEQYLEILRAIPEKCEAVFG